MSRPLPLYALLTLLLAGADSPKTNSAAESSLLKHIQVLASDEFEGRGPGTPGEEKAVGYIATQLKAIGLKPGNPNGTYIQEAPLVGFKTEAEGLIRVGDIAFPLKSLDDWVAVSRRQTKSVAIKTTDIVFVGYGVVAPEYGWDDYKGVDVKNKTIIMLVGDPQVPDPANPSKLDETMFKGKAMTYYGRWTYKYEIAAEKGAAAALIVHETGPAGYPFSVVQGSWSRENFDLPAPDKNVGRAAIEGWLPLDKAKAVLKAANLDFDTLKASAAKKNFRPVVIPGGHAGFEAENSLRQVKSKNVVGLLEGSDPKLKDEYVVYTAHWDHLGVDPKLPGDQIFNGAADNASGVAAVLEAAKLFSAGERPKRSILFLLVTAEEKGLLGAKYYATHPLYPLDRTLADINLDVINLWGRTSDISSVGMGQTTLDDLLGVVASAHGRTIGSDTEPEKGLYYRSDHFEFAKNGVPALNLKGGDKYLGKGDDYGAKVRDGYTQNDYHKPSDEVKADWDLSGAVEDVGIAVEVGRIVANGSKYPEWKPTSEFRAKREAMLKDKK